MRDAGRKEPVIELAHALKDLLRPGARAVQRGRERHRQFQLRRGLKALRNYPSVALEPGNRVLRRLVYGWGNEVWSAREEYLRATVAEALESAGPILECGSGLTTLVLASVAGGRRLPVWSLEHSEEWAERARRGLSALGDSSVRLCVRPLRRAGDVDWYDPPLESMPARFALVICDGPPSTTRGGRYGLSTVMRGRLGPGTVILLDDAERSGEREIAARWATELDAEYQVLGAQKPYIRMVLRQPGRSR